MQAGACGELYLPVGRLRVAKQLGEFDCGQHCELEGCQAAAQLEASSNS